MSEELSSVANQLLTADVAFVKAFFEATELEARQTERYVLATLGAMYSYFATKSIPPRLKYLAWYSPTLIVAFAGIRAVGLGLRQHQLLTYLMEVEGRFPAKAQGWATWFQGQPSVVAPPTMLFYLLLFSITLFVARRMAKNDGLELSAKGPCVPATDS